VGSTSVLAATSEELRDHWAAWRPEWTTQRTCLYWYLTFGGDQVSAAVGEKALQAVRGVGWLDAVPPQWCHVTVADVGFADELEPSDVEQVTAAVAADLAEEQRLEITLGPVQTFPSALVLPVGPLERLRALKARVRRSTSAVLGAKHTDVHRRLFWPHLSLGYVNQRVDARTTGRFLDALPAVNGRLDASALTLAAVTRRDHGYRWRVRAQAHLRGNGARSPG
jgi:2'-5' RNA ligase